MSQGEFDIIARYFQRQVQGDEIVLGIGDDCAVIDIELGYQLAVTTDTLVSGIHFFEDVSPYRLGYKSLAVNLSDLAAMGAKAKWVSLAITLPKVEPCWLAEFCRGFFELADKYQVQLIGGDTTKGPLSITVTAQGLVPVSKALTRNKAQDNDIICVSGCIGDGGAGLAVKLGQLSCQNSTPFIDALELTEPRLEFAHQLIGIANSCIDISDGLTQDIKHILTQSDCYAEICIEQLPLSEAMLDEVAKGTISLEQARHFALNGGDDYELLFTLAEPDVKVLSEQLAMQGLKLFSVGKVSKRPIAQKQNTQNRLLLTVNKQPVDLQLSGWDHFK